MPKPNYVRQVYVERCAARRARRFQRRRDQKLIELEQRVRELEALLTNEGSANRAARLLTEAIRYQLVKPK